MLVKVATGTAGAAEIVTADVARSESLYVIEASVRLDAELGQIVSLLARYETWVALSPTLVSSRLVSGRSGGQARLAMVLRPCVLLVFCKTIRKVSDVYPQQDGQRIRYVAVPAASDFHFAEETLTVRGLPASPRAQVELSYAALLEPDFFVPPFVGIWLIRQRIVADLVAAARKAEQIVARSERDIRIQE